MHKFFSQIEYNCRWEDETQSMNKGKEELSDIKDRQVSKSASLGFLHHICLFTFHIFLLSLNIHLS